MSRSPLRVAAVQMDCSGRLEEVEKRALKMIGRAAKLGASIACLPEHWNRKGIEDKARFLRTFKDAAREFQIYIVSGGDFVREDGSTFVEGFLFGPEGLVGVQRKVHLFRGERRRAVPGSSYPVFRAGGAKVGIAICHDLVYPEVARILALGGAEVIFSPALIGETGLVPWHIYIKARALENRIPVVSPNFLAPPKIPGGSLVVGLQDIGKGIIVPKVLAKGGQSPKLLVADLDLNQTNELRRERLRARRVETYAPLLRSGR